MFGALNGPAAHAASHTFNFEISYYLNAPVTWECLVPADFGLRRIAHFGFLWDRATRKESDAPAVAESRT